MRRVPGSWSTYERQPSGARAPDAATLLLVAALTLVIAAAPGCRRGPRVSDEIYREAVTAFYVALAAMQTSQELHARKEFDRFVQLVPEEPAGWANLGLLALRQQQFDEAEQRLTKAAELAPESAAIERLRALTASRKGDLEAATRHWRSAVELDPANGKAPFALARDLERLGGDANQVEAQRALDGLARRSGNLAAQIEFARVAARRGDAAALGKALDALAGRASSWPADAQERLKTAREVARTNAAAATTPIIFLKNLLLREPEYRAAFAEVSSGVNEVGEPLVQFIALANPQPRPAPPDDRLAFSVDERPAVATSGASWAGVAWLTADGAAALLTAGPREVRFGSGAIVALPADGSFTNTGLDGLAIADLNYDFRNDLVLAGSGGLQIYRQNDKGGFAAITPATKLPADVTTAPLHAVWPADIDTDGDLDLVLAPRDGPHRVLRNNTDDTFAVLTPFGNVSRLRGFAWADIDGEGVPDAALVDDQGVLRVFLNQRGGSFRERPIPPQFPRVAAIAAAEITGDGILDIVGVAPNGAVARLSQPAGRSSFEAAQAGRIDPPSGTMAGNTRLLPADLDNNGATDFVLSSAAASRVLLAVEPRSFRAIGESNLPGSITSVADLDGDGRLELIARGNDGARVVRVKGEKPYRWHVLRPRATTATGDQRINSFGIGGEVEVRTGPHAQKQVIAAPVVHFGLGEARTAEVARITWPNGVLQSEFDLPSNSAVNASQRLKGSCPWVFAWNGQEMGFVTDFIWRSPLGLRINAQATADVQMTEDWVRIRGDQLTPRNGEYDLRITAELWETHFFDLVSLLVVDHPEDTEVFVDERFAVPPPPFAVIATSRVQPFARVHDDGGRDVSDAVAAQDDRHLDFAGRGRYQGVTRDHHVELELPDAAPRTGPLWLVARGWVHPTDSSVNVALGQGSHLAPTGLSLHVADAAGRYKVARAGLGFPSGKDKTILLDLGGLLPRTGPRRVRLTTNLEIFWDRIGWAVGRPDVTLTPHRLELKMADLRYRGYSVTDQKDASTPERPRYVLDGVAPRWRDLEGYHTRFGDVRELLQQVDDRYVIMNAGDEIRLAFPEVAPPQAGLAREFVLVGDGWVKDGDYNTVASRTMLPLPTHRSPSYVAGTGRLEDDPVYQRHRADFEHYHTRYVSPEEVRDALRVKIDADPRAQTSRK
jgi:tetratricopeptide (TPR) repeat protein